MLTERASLEPTVSNPTNYIGTRTQEEPPWWHADLCQDHKHTRSDEDQKTTTLGGILAEEIHKTADKIFAGADRPPPARPLPGPWQGPCRGPQRSRRHARTCQGSIAVPMQLQAQPAGQAPVW